MIRYPAIVLAVLLLWVSSLAALAQSNPAASRTEARIKVGDVLGVTVVGFEQFSGDFEVLDDGSIAGPGFDRVRVAGLNVAQAKAAISNALSKRLKKPAVGLKLVKQRPEVVFLLNGANGPANATPIPSGLPLLPGTTLRQFLTSVAFNTEADQLELTLLRGPASMVSDKVSSVINPTSGSGNMRLEPNDVVTILPIAQVRVWVTGEVKLPGRYLIASGSDVYQAIAIAGGADIKNPGVRIKVRRGPEIIEVATTMAIASKPLALETGDTIMVESPKRLHVTVAGAVTDPGPVTVDEGTSVVATIANAGRLDLNATLVNVLIVRGTEIFRLDLSHMQSEDTMTSMKVMEGDLIYVRVNERRVYVLGDVRLPGPIMMEDNRAYRLSDAIARAQSLEPTGSLRRIHIARPAENGKYVVKAFDLDKFLKSGDENHNPLLQPDDVIFVGQPKGLKLGDFGALSSILSPVLVLDSIFRRR